MAAPRPVELIQIETSGDVVRDLPLSQIGGDGVFTKEIQRALLTNVVDVAVHSLKDLPTTYVEGLTLGSGPAAWRDRRRFCVAAPRPLRRLAARRRRRHRQPAPAAQALHRRPDLKLTAIRGNVGTRLHKLDEQGLDAIILAQAGLERLGLSAHITEILDPLWMLPAVGQGALGLECRADDSATLSVLKPLERRADAASGIGGARVVARPGRRLPGADRRAGRDRGRSADAARGGAGAGRLAARGGRGGGAGGEAEQIGQALAERMLQQGARELLAMQR